MNSNTNCPKKIDNQSVSKTPEYGIIKAVSKGTLFETPSAGMKYVRLAFILIYLCCFQLAIYAQPPQSQEAVNFLKEFVIEHNKNAERRGGIGVEFTGKFKELPAELAKDLSSSFPDHQFIVAKMNKFHMGIYPETLLLITDAQTGIVTSYAWDLPFDGVSDSFRKFLNFYNAKSKIDAIKKVKALSDVLIFVGEGRVGNVEIKRNACFSCWVQKDLVVSELFYSYQPGDIPFRILEVQINDKLKFGDIKLINPFDGKEGSKASLSSFNKLN
jgi:hypothetical protein